MMSASAYGRLPDKMEKGYDPTSTGNNQTGADNNEEQAMQGYT